MKLCKDCKWHDNRRCKAPQNMTATDPVTGEKFARWLLFCISHRTGSCTSWLGCRLHNLCGKEGRWFTPSTKDKRLKTKTKMKTVTIEIQVPDNYQPDSDDLDIWSDSLCDYLEHKVISSAKTKNDPTFNLQCASIAGLVKMVSKEVSFERGAICAADCLLQYCEGELQETMAAWMRYLGEHRSNQGHNDTLRHGAWVPAIPM